MHGLTHSGAAAGVRPISGVFVGDPVLTNFAFQQGVAGYAGTHDTWIESANLTFYTGATASDASVARMDLYRLTVPFVDGATWSSMGGGITVGAETATPADFSFKPRNNSVNVIFDVTASVS